jgi:hypothetical protein
MIARRLLTLALAAACLPAAAQNRVTCADLRVRKLPSYDSARAGETVTVRGVISAPPFHFPEYTLAAIQDGDGGAALEAPKGSAALDALRPGDEVEAEGVVAGLAGMPVVVMGRVSGNVGIRGMRFTESIGPFQQHAAACKGRPQAGYFFGKSNPER